MFDAIRSETIERLRHCMATLSFIKDNERERFEEDSIDVINIRGLFYVMLYAAIENTFNATVSVYLSFLNMKNIEINHTNYFFLSVAADAHLRSFRAKQTSRNITEMNARLKLLEGMFTEEAVAIDSNFFGNYSQNINPKLISMVEKCLYIGTLALSSRDNAYLTEITEKRNKVAHGRESAHDIGKTSRADELKIRFDATRRIALHFIATFESEVDKLSCIKENFKPQYINN